MIDKNVVNKLADLSKLKFDDNELETIMGDLNKMLSFIEQLQKVDTDGVEPLVYMTEEQNIFRDDVVEPSMNKQDALSNAPDADSDYFKVPKVIKSK